VVFVMKISRELRCKYKERRARDVEDLTTSLEAERFEVLSRIGHQLKGNASTYGYEELAVLGRKMEHAAEEKSLSEAHACLVELRVWVSQHDPGAIPPS